MKKEFEIPTIEIIEFDKKVNLSGPSNDINNDEWNDDNVDGDGWV